MTASPHLAAGAAAGYVYQMLVALHELVPFAQAAEDATVTLEVIDDVAFHDLEGDPLHALQVNHSLGDDGDLLDSSAKAWRTLAIWAGEWTALQPGEHRRMSLITTRTVRAGTGLEALTDRAWNLDTAHPRLAAVAVDPDGATGTAADRATFVALGENAQRAMLAHVRVVDQHPGLADARATLERLLSASHESRYVESMADALEGWWWNRVARALITQEPTTAEAARVRIDEARRSLNDRSLPVADLSEFPDADLSPMDPSTATFVACLREIAASERRVQAAIDDYRLAFAHRSRWGRRLLVLPDEFLRYDRRLLRQWTIHSDQMLRVLRDTPDGDVVAKANAGHDLWDRMESSVREPLRLEVYDAFIQSGSLHLLADAEDLAWHPDRVQRIVDRDASQEAA